MILKVLNLIREQANRHSKIKGFYVRSTSDQNVNGTFYPNITIKTDGVRVTPYISANTQDNNTLTININIQCWVNTIEDEFGNESVINKDLAYVEQNNEIVALNAQNRFCEQSVVYYLIDRSSRYLQHLARYLYDQAEQQNWFTFRVLNQTFSLNSFSDNITGSQMQVEFIVQNEDYCEAYNFLKNQ